MQSELPEKFCVGDGVGQHGEAGLVAFVAREGSGQRIQSEFFRQ